MNSPDFRRSLLLPVVLLAAAAMFAGPGWAGDWPQILGPGRNGIAADASLDLQRVSDPDSLAWKHPLGQGYAGPAVQDGRVVIFHRVEAGNRAEALDLRTGRRIWRTDLPAGYEGGIDPDNGPRCVPLIHQKRVLLVTAGGDLHCLNWADGRKIWSRRTAREFRAPDGYFGAGSTPIAFGDAVLMNVGGRDAGVVAFALKDGQTLWQATDERASYSAPIRYQIDRQEGALFVTRLSAVALDPSNGKTLFRFPFGKRGPTVNAALPVRDGDRVFLTASYGIGGQLRDLGGEQPTIWANDASLSSQYATPVLHNGYLYGTHGREDLGQAELRCVEWKTGRVMWREAGFGVANPVLVGETLLLQQIDGTLVAARPTPERFDKQAEREICAATTRALPAFADGHWLVRSTSSQGGALYCLRLRAE